MDSQSLDVGGRGGAGGLVVPWTVSHWMWEVRGGAGGLVVPWTVSHWMWEVGVGQVV